MTSFGDSYCHAKKGLLVLRECGKLAFTSCSACGAGLCEDHRILTVSGEFCPDCAAGDNRFNNLNDERLDRARYRTSGYYPWGDWYNTGDYGTFDTQSGANVEADQTAGAAGAALDSDDDAADPDDLDSYTES